MFVHHKIGLVWHMKIDDGSIVRINSIMHWEHGSHEVKKIRNRDSLQHVQTEVIHFHNDGWLVLSKELAPSHDDVLLESFNIDFQKAGWILVIGEIMIKRIDLYFFGGMTTFWTNLVTDIASRAVIRCKRNC